MSKFIDNAFLTIPKTEESFKLYNELVGEYNEKCNEFIRDGLKKRKAIKETDKYFAEIIDSKLTDVKPSEEFLEEADIYRNTIRKKSGFAKIIIHFSLICLAILSKLNRESTNVDVDTTILAFLIIAGIIVIGNIIMACTCLPLNKSVPENMSTYFVQQCHSFKYDKPAKIGSTIFKHYLLESVSILVLSLIFSYYFILASVIGAISNDPVNKIAPKKKK